MWEMTFEKGILFQFSCYFVTADNSKAVILLTKNLPILFTKNTRVVDKNVAEYGRVFYCGTDTSFFFNLKF